MSRVYMGCTHATDGRQYHTFTSGASAPGALASTVVAKGAFVTRMGFRAVCTVLLDAKSEEESLVLSADGGGGFVIEGDREQKQEEDDHGQEARGCSPEPATENASGLDNGYTKDQPSAPGARPYARHRPSSASSSSSTHISKPLTASRKEENLAAFAPFFPLLPADQPSIVAPYICDIKRIASLVRSDICGGDF